jgi:hypothetical protein
VVHTSSFYFLFWMDRVNKYRYQSTSRRLPFEARSTAVFYTCFCFAVGGSNAEKVFFCTFWCIQVLGDGMITFMWLWMYSIVYPRALFTHIITSGISSYYWAVWVTEIPNKFYASFTAVWISYDFLLGL